MAGIDHLAPTTGRSDDEAPRGLWRRCLDRLQDWIAGPDEQFAAERGWVATRSAWGWSVTVHDPRFDRRHVCDVCRGTGRHLITGGECADCGGVGVVTDPERGERA